MSGRRVSILNCKEGCILARDVVNDCGIKIAAKNTILTSYMLDRLANLGIDEIHIDEEGNNDDLLGTNDSLLDDYRKSYVKKVNTLKDIINDLAVGKVLDIRKVNEISEAIYREMVETDDIIRYLTIMKCADEYTYRHCLNTSIYAGIIGRWLNLDTEQVKEIVKSGLLHDIGKTRIPDTILNKRGKLSTEEFEEIKNHAAYGYLMLKEAVGISSAVKEAILNHHERVDGSGYPNGQKGYALHLYAKILAIADVFDAMTSDRVYKSKVSPFEALEMFKTIGIGIFDIDILNIFINKLPKYYLGADVMLSTGEIGQIIYIPPHNIFKPIVKVSDKLLDLSEDDQIEIQYMI